MPEPREPGDIFADWLNAALSSQSTASPLATPDTDDTTDTEENES